MSVPDELTRHLPAWIVHARYLESVDSTNSYAARLVSEGAGHGTLVLAEDQTAGRGRLDRSWFSAPGESLAFSIILEPDIPSLVNVTAAVCLCRALHEDSRIKWPNDVYLQERKIAGILSQAAGASVVLGVGVNVNVTEFPSEIAGSAGSLLLSTGKAGDRFALLGNFLERLGAGLDADPADLLARYRELCETIGKRVRVMLAGETVEEVAAGVDAEGGLLLESGRVVRAGDVIHVR